MHYTLRHDFFLQISLAYAYRIFRRLEIRFNKSKWFRESFKNVKSYLLYILKEIFRIMLVCNVLFLKTKSLQTFFSDAKKGILYNFHAASNVLQALTRSKEKLYLNLRNRFINFVFFSI